MCKSDSKRVFDESVELKDNAMLRARLELFNEWDFKKNDVLELDVYKATKGSHKIAWWNCPDCKSLYDMEVADRAGKRKGNCPYCSGNRVNHTNSLAALNPSLASEWHPLLNEKSPNEVTCSSGENVWWLGECGHEWDMIISNRSRKEYRCPYCSNQKLLVGFNDIWTTSPDLASQLINPEDGYKYMQGSKEPLDWKCNICENTIENKVIYSISQQGLSCPKCSDDISFGEKFMYNLLKEANIDFSYDTAQKWSGLFRYDFYLPEYNWIIEVHGIQHYEESSRGRSLKEEQDNDKLKERIASINGINKYIVIDARYSTVEQMKDSILNSDIIKIAPEINFVRIGELASNSFVKTACDLWSLGTKSTTKIAENMKISYNTVSHYLKRGAEIGWCDYSAKKIREVVQLDKNLCLLYTYASTTVASNALNIDYSGISKVCNGKRRTAYGFKWMYKEDYDKIINDSLSKRNKTIDLL